jgi:hypothetical protein
MQRVMSEKTIFNQYYKDLSQAARQGDAREESFYSACERMLTSFAQETGKPQVHVTTLPKPTDAGNPDFRVWNGADRITGYIEAKKPTEENLDQIEKSEQLNRYRDTFPNLILTNFLEFRLYRDGQCVEKVTAIPPLVFNQLKVTTKVEKPDELSALLERFLDFSLPRTFTAESLAIELAKRTRFLRDIVQQEMQKDTSGSDMLAGFYEAFKTYLIGTLDIEDFSDLFAQTITYGLFAARIRAKSEFTRATAFNNIPHTIGVLRDLFRFISLGDMPDQLAWCVDDIAQVLAVADAPGILSEYYRTGKGSDPIVHFYETFLAQYDPKERERRGVYYTPEPVVSYIVRSIHEILKSHFGKADGLADTGVTVLDPAAGTMTFIAKAAQVAVDEFTAKYGHGGKEEFIREHVLKDFYAFELMMAPYAVGHLKMGFFLEELGHTLQDDERMPFYLTNTLEYEELDQSRLPGLSALAEESRLAGVVKKQTPILVILGNPPYSGHSTNTGEWIKGLIDSYKMVDGKPLGERNPKWLQDDYVKFLRFAQWKIDQAGSGVVGMITNHGYLDNPTFRGMRQSLMKTFDEIVILDLHGNTLKKEISPDGSIDENVFDIRQGVAIAILIKKYQSSGKTFNYYDIHGDRESKYGWLNDNQSSNINHKQIEPIKPFYLFIPYDKCLTDQYQQFPSIEDIFLVNSVGIVTARDSLTIQWSENEAFRTASIFGNLDPGLARTTFKLRGDSKDWSIKMAQKDIIDSGINRKNIQRIAYRPFDNRYTYYTGNSRGFHCRSRSEVMKHFINISNNIGLIVNKQIAISDINHTWITRDIVDLHILETAHASAYVFPLYLFRGDEQIDLFESSNIKGPRINIKETFLTEVSTKLKIERDFENILFYSYGVLFSQVYKNRYSDLLIRDFPRIPFTENVDVFNKMAKYGNRLAKLHLLESNEINPPIVQFDISGENNVNRGRTKGLRYDPDQRRVFINETQFFAPVPPEVWEYQIGGYQVCEKWLKDRYDRRLSLDEIQTYCRIVTALARTIEIQEEIDKLYPLVEENLLDIQL